VDAHVVPTSEGGEHLIAGSNAGIWRHDVEIRPASSLTNE
jgi:hypothetical protein